MSDFNMLWACRDGERGNWEKNAGVDRDTKDAFFPAAFAGDELEVMMRAAREGETVLTYLKHPFVRASWMAVTYPETSDAILKGQEHMRKQLQEQLDKSLPTLPTLTEVECGAFRLPDAELVANVRRAPMTDTTQRISEYRLHLADTRHNASHQARFVKFLTPLYDGGFAYDGEERNGKLVPCVSWNPHKGVYRMEIADVAGTPHPDLRLLSVLRLLAEHGFVLAELKCGQAPEQGFGEKVAELPFGEGYADECTLEPWAFPSVCPPPTLYDEDGRKMGEQCH
jgi:hypothetical protein